MKQAKITTDDRKVTVAAKKRAEETGVACAAIEFEDGTIITSNNRFLRSIISTQYLTRLNILLNRA